MKKKRLSGEGKFLGMLIDGGIYNGDWRRFSFKPENVTDVQRLCRTYEEAVFVGMGLKLLKGFANWGCQLRPVEKKDRKKLNDWLDKNQKEKRRQIVGLIEEVWHDRFLMDSVVAFWREATGGMQRAFTLQPEDCVYSDDFGIETLKVRLTLSQDALKKLSERERRRYGSGKDVELSEEEGEHFRVLKRARIGKGFGMPRLRGLLDTLKASESLEVMDNLWGFAARLALRQIKLGYEIKSGPRAGLPTQHYKQKVADNLKRFFEGRMGFAEWIGNFDQEILFPFPSLDRWDKKKFEGVYQRIAMWLGPTGMLLFGAKGNEDVLMRMLRTQMHEERTAVGLYLGDVLNNGFNPPVPMEVVWNDRVFMDSRQVMEMTKFLLSQGALSQRSGLESVGEDQEEQWDEKDEEALQLKAESKRHRVLPVFDPAHGQSPGDAPGRPAGQKSKAAG